jgi:Tol biopolymer transport system component
VGRRSVARRVAVVTACACVVSVSGQVAGAEAGVEAAPRTVLVSVTGAGRPVEGLSVSPSISAGGNRVAFQSSSDDLVRGDDNQASDVFVRDLAAGTTRRVSVGRGGADGDGSSTSPSISADGRYVTFTSGAEDLVGNDGNGVSDIFRRDLRTGRTVRVSVGLGGVPAGRIVSGSSVSGDGNRVAFQVFVGGAGFEIYVRDLAAGTTRKVSRAVGDGQANGSSFNPTISADGRYVAFLSAASNLVARDDNGFVDVFRRDLAAARTRLASRDRFGGGADADAIHGPPSISPRGRYVVFFSDATDLVAGDTNGEPDVFRRDLAAGSTRRISVDSAGHQVFGFGNFHIVRTGVSEGGRYVAFSSDSSGLASNDHNGQPDVFLRDVVAGTTALVSVATSGEAPNGFSTEPAISADARYVAFSSDAPGLTGNDTNGGVNDVFRRTVS